VAAGRVPQDKPHGGPGKFSRWWPPILLAAATIGIYVNSFGGAFLFDDRVNIHERAAVHHVWPPDWLHTQRPLTAMTLAVNWVTGGSRPFGYHLVNLAIHVGAVMLLFGCVRRSAARILSAPSATCFAAAAALLWAVHPLQTQAVTYIIQRSEALPALLVLLALYAAIRALPPSAAGRCRAWIAIAVLACALAQLAKPVAVVAPLLIVLYDQSIWFSSMRAAIRSRWGLYAGLCASWAVPLGLGVVRGLLTTSAGKSVTVGFGVTQVSPWLYLCTEAGVIVHYLHLAYWPNALVLDYGWPVARGLVDAWAPGLMIIALLAVAAALGRRWPWASYCILWFFVALAPTSSIVPIVDPAFEHRMYLALAGVVVITVGAAWYLLTALGRRVGLPRPTLALIAGLFVVLTAGGLAARTVARNRDYADPVRLWRRNALDRPRNPRAHNNVCQALIDAGDDTAALAACDAALALAPDYADAWNNRANALLGLDRPQEAVEAACTQALAQRPDFTDAHVTCGYALTLVGDLDAAIEHERTAVAAQPDNLLALNNLGNALGRRGDLQEARSVLDRALALAPNRLDTHNNLAWLLATQGDLEGAARHLERAVALDPAQFTARFNLGEIYRRMGRAADTRRVWTEALRWAVEQKRTREADMIRQRLKELSRP